MAGMSRRRDARRGSYAQKGRGLLQPLGVEDAGLVDSLVGVGAEEIALGLE